MENPAKSKTTANRKSAEFSRSGQCGRLWRTPDGRRLTWSSRTTWKGRGHHETRRNRRVERRPREDECSSEVRNDRRSSHGAITIANMATSCTSGETDSRLPKRRETVEDSKNSSEYRRTRRNPHLRRKIHARSVRNCVEQRRNVACTNACKAAIE